MKEETMVSLPIFSKSKDGEIEVLMPTSGGGAKGLVWRNGTRVSSAFFIEATLDGIALTRGEVISLIRRSVVEALPKE
jgi:hypothetical protein